MWMETLLKAINWKNVIHKFFTKSAQFDYAYFVTVSQLPLDRLFKDGNRFTESDVENVFTMWFSYLQGSFTVFKASSSNKYLERTLILVICWKERKITLQKSD